MHKLSWMSQYLLERVADNLSKPESVGDSDVIGVGKIDLGNFNTIVVKNPKGVGLSNKKDPKSGFGFGMGLDAPTAAFASDLIKNYGSVEDKKPESDDDAGLPNWQQVNRAVGNYVRQNIDNVLRPMGLGRVAKNPAGRYDGMDTTKIGTILDKKFGKGKIKSIQF